MRCHRFIHVWAILTSRAMLTAPWMSSCLEQTRRSLHLLLSDHLFFITFHREKEKERVCACVGEREKRERGISASAEKFKGFFFFFFISFHPQLNMKAFQMRLHLKQFFLLSLSHTPLSSLLSLSHTHNHSLKPRICEKSFLFPWTGAAVKSWVLQGEDKKGNI